MITIGASKERTPRMIPAIASPEPLYSVGFAFARLRPINPVTIAAIPRPTGKIPHMKKAIVGKTVSNPNNPRTMEIIASIELGPFTAGGWNGVSLPNPCPCQFASGAAGGCHSAGAEFTFSGSDGESNGFAEPPTAPMIGAAGSAGFDSFALGSMNSGAFGSPNGDGMGGLVFEKSRSFGCESNGDGGVDIGVGGGVGGFTGSTGFDSTGGFGFSAAGGAMNGGGVGVGGGSLAAGISSSPDKTSWISSFEETIVFRGSSSFGISRTSSCSGSGVAAGFSGSLNELGIAAAMSSGLATIVL